MLVYILLVALTILIWKTLQKPKNFPPGPPKLPLVGSLPYLTGPDGKASLFHGMRNLVGKYGKVAGLYMGSTPFVLVSDFDVLKDLLKMEETSARPHMRPFNEGRLGHGHPGLDGRSLGLVFSQGEVWKEQRRFVSRHLRDFGFGKSSMEEMFHLEVEKLLNFLSPNVGKVTSLNGVLNVSIVNALWTILVGEKLELDDPRLKKIVMLADKLGETTPQSSLALVLPSPSFLKLPFLRDISGASQQIKVFQPIQEMIGSQMRSHLDDLDASEPRDMLDVLLDHVQTTTDSRSSFYGKMGSDSINNILLDLFVAGMETTSSTLVWTFLYMLHHPEIQEKVYQEISKIVGSDRLPSLSDQDRMPFTNAVLHESLRITGFAFLGVPHFATKDIVLLGPSCCTIPSGSTILPNLHYIMNDPDYWKDPEEFRPERFVDPQGRFVKDERVIPFSVGKRYCLGQSLAEKELFLFFTSIVQRFRLKEVEGGKGLPSVDVRARDYSGLARIAPHYDVVLEKRCA